MKKGTSHNLPVLNYIFQIGCSKNTVKRFRNKLAFLINECVFPPSGGRGDFGKVKHRRNMVLPPHNLELERRQDAGIAVELRTCYANILPSLLSDSSHGHLHAAPPCIAMDVCPSLDVSFHDILSSPH